MIYLDHNSTTPLAPEAAAAMAEWQSGQFGNPASQHAAGRRARQALEHAREEIGRILGANLGGRHPDRLIFTSGGTEANNLALLGITGCHEPHAVPSEVVISAIEHPSITAPAAALERHGWQVPRLPVGSDGVVEVAALDPLLNPRTRLVSVMLANNETGVLQPVSELAARCRARRIPFHTDAVQVAGKVPLDFRSLGVDALTVAAHKFHGPLGIGALLVRHDVELHPQLLGGFQQGGYRGGTESVALAVGMYAALAAWENEAAERSRRMATLRDRFEAELVAHCRAQPTAAPQAVLCARVERYRAELFVFVADPAVPPTNNAAERALRPLVVARKISGGTRSDRGTTTRMVLQSLVATWEVRGLDPVAELLALLRAPRPALDVAPV